MQRFPWIMNSWQVAQTGQTAPQFLCLNATRTVGAPCGGDNGGRLRGSRGRLPLLHVSLLEDFFHDLYGQKQCCARPEVICKLIGAEGNMPRTLLGKNV